MYIKVNGLMIRLKEKEFIYIKMDLLTLDNGSMINNMVLGNKNGLMELFIKDHSKMD
jgi:hypothetical protein